MNGSWIVVNEVLLHVVEPQHDKASFRKYATSKDSPVYSAKELVRVLKVRMQ